MKSPTFTHPKQEKKPGNARAFVPSRVVFTQPPLNPSQFAGGTVGGFSVLAFVSGGSDSFML